MNRRQKRQMEKQLGLTKRRQNLSITQKIKENEENILVGRRKNQEMIEERRRQENEAADKAAAMEVSSLATTLMVQHKLSWHQALEAAKLEIAAREPEEETK